jgi:hypothetical protein
LAWALRLTVLSLATFVAQAVYGLAGTEGS